MMNKAEVPSLKLGVTGGIGSGKTSVCRVFNVLGIPVFSTDRVAREIMDNDEYIISQINSIAGRDMYSNGFLDRMALASLIFNDNDLLEKVNSLVHPVVFEQFSRWERIRPLLILLWRQQFYLRAEHQILSTKLPLLLLLRKKAHQGNQEKQTDQASGIGKNEESDER